MAKRMAALWQRAIGKMLLAGAHRGGVADRGVDVTELQGLAADAKMLLAWLPMQRCRCD